MIVKIWLAIRHWLLWPLIPLIFLGSHTALGFISNVQTSDRSSPLQLASFQAQPGGIYLPLVLKGLRPNVYGVEFPGKVRESVYQEVFAAEPSWVRMTSTGVKWYLVEPVEGERLWSALSLVETRLQKYAQAGIQVILVIQGTPSWAQKEAGYLCGPVRQDKLAAFAQFMEDLVARYSQSPYHVKYWELWNEPDIDPSLVLQDSGFGCWGDADDPFYGGGYYSEMLQVIAPRMRAVDPDARVLIGGLLLDCDPRNPPQGKDCASSLFFEGILQGDATAASFDGISFHAYDYYAGGAGNYTNYGWSTTDESRQPLLVPKAKYLNELLDQYQVNGKFLMNTENGLLCDDYQDNPTFEFTKAYYVTYAYVSAFVEGLQANIWYHVYGWRGSALFDSDDQPLPAFFAFRFGIQELNQAVFQREVKDFEGIRVYEFFRDDRIIWVIWSGDGQTHSMIPLPGVPVAIYDPFGEPVGALTEIDIVPLYIEMIP